MRYHRPPRFSCCLCGVVLTRGTHCDDCMAESYAHDEPCCEAPGCTREIGYAEHLCAVHQALAAGEAPREGMRPVLRAVLRGGTRAAQSRDRKIIDVTPCYLSATAYSIPCQQRAGRSDTTMTTYYTIDIGYDVAQAATLRSARKIASERARGGDTVEIYRVTYDTRDLVETVRAGRVLSRVSR